MDNLGQDSGSPKPSTNDFQSGHDAQSHINPQIEKTSGKPSDSIGDNAGKDIDADGDVNMEIPSSTDADGQPVQPNGSPKPSMPSRGATVESMEDETECRQDHRTADPDGPVLSPARSTTPSGNDSVNSSTKADGALPRDFFENLREKTGRSKKPLTQAEKERLLAEKAASLYPHNFTTATAKERAETSSSTRNEGSCSDSRGTDEASDRDLHTAPDAEEDSTFAKAQKEYKEKKAKGIRTLEDEINFIKARTKEEELQKKRAEDIEAEKADELRQFDSFGPESLFVDEEGAEEEYEDNYDASFEDPSRVRSFGGEDQQGRSRKAPPTRKLPAMPRFSQTDRDESLDAGLYAIKAGHEKKKKKKGGAKGNATGAKAKKNASGTGTKRKRGKKADADDGNAAPPKKKGRRGKAERAAAAAEGEISSLSDLANGNVLAEGAAAANDVTEEPTLASRRKDLALKSMISQVPTENQPYAHLDKDSLDNATKMLTWRRAQINVEGNGWSIKGMTCILKNFQLLGLARLRGLERRASQPKGGIIADSMGLGKTVSMLANMVDGEAHPGDPRRSTLVVVPAAILGQWMREIREHLDHRMLPNVQIYDGTNKFRDEIRTLQHSDIVLTTYDTLRRSYPKNNPPKDLTEQEQIEWFKEQYDCHRGPLHRVSWLRVVLDECNAIKNYKSQTAIAACGLIARHRWLSSGTIVTNNISEFYSYFKFLKAPYTGSIELFTQNFLKDEKAQTRLFAILKSIMIRRTHKDRFLGAPLVKLPTTEMHTIEIDFSKVERNIYDIVYERCEKSVQQYVKNRSKSPREIFCHAFLRLLLLRELTGHFKVCAATLHKFLTKTDMGKLIALCVNEDPQKSDDTIQKLRQILSDVESEMDKATSASERSDSMEPEDDRASQDQPSSQEVQRVFGPEQSEAAIEDSLCVQCAQPPGEDAWDIDCSHVLCDECLDALKIRATITGLKGPSCPTCCITFEATQRNGGAETPRKKKRATRAWDNIGFFHSSKTRAIKAAILNWTSETPEVKIVIYTQFLAMSEIIAQVCTELHCTYVKYNGSMDMKAREKAIMDFQNKPDIQIFVASLKAGGVGLNLTQATRVLLVDLYWNSALEEQAFCRVFRIGQTQHTVIHRFAIKNTVDAELIKLQDRKKKEIDQVLNGNRKTPLKLADLFTLFGLKQGRSCRGEGDESPFLVPNEAVEELIGDLPADL